LFHDFINWIREDLGRFTEDGQSWSHQLHESLFMWNIIEGTHVLTIMFFAGTIWMIDLRMMGIAFKNMPLSKLSDRVLPITIISMVAMVITGLIAFIGRDPLMYYHNIWFRLKMVFLLAAMINIVWFHYRVQKSDVAWDVIPPMSDPLPVKKTLWLAAFIASSFAVLVSFLIAGDPWVLSSVRILLSVVGLVALFMLIHKRTPGLPLVVKLSGALSMLAWFLVIIFGRFIAYDWFYCEKETTTPGSLMYVLQECDSALAFREEGGEEMIEEEVIEEEAPAEDAAADGEAPAEEAPAEEAPAEPAAPAQPAPGEGN
jgi:hypothetical protein